MLSPPQVGQGTMRGLALAAGAADAPDEPAPVDEALGAAGEVDGAEKLEVGLEVMTETSWSGKWRLMAANGG